MISFIIVSGFILTVCYVIFTFVNRHVLRQPKDLTKYGGWAVVTGSTDGIGKAIAEEFAKRKLNLILISRTESKLKEQAKELETGYGVETKVFPIDFSTDNSSKFSAYREAIKSLDVGILVNNVGLSYDHAQYYTELETGLVQKLIRVNIQGLMDMTDITLPGMLERKRGAIINVSSASSLVSEPLYAVYSATKAFVNNYSVALHFENKERGVHVQAQLPAYVTTKLSKIRKSSLLVATPRSYAQAFIRQIGYEAIVVSYWSHDVQLYLSSFLPTWILGPYLLSMGKSIRSRALKKKAL